MKVGWYGMVLHTTQIQCMQYQEEETVAACQNPHTISSRSHFQQENISVNVRSFIHYTWAVFEIAY